MYLVTGGGGFIGSSLVRKLLARGEKVRVLDDFSTGKKKNLSGINSPDFDLIEGSLLDKGLLKKALTGVNYILHQGAIPSVPRSIADPVGSNEVNVTGTLKLLTFAKEAGVKKVVFAASSSAYGDTETMPKVESMPANPLSPYAVAKYSGELYMKIFAGIYDLPTVSLRYFNIFGPRQDPASEYAAVIPKFITAMLDGKRPVIYGDGEQSRDFTYIDNACEANLLAATSEAATKGEVLNIACGERFTLNELVQLLNEILACSIEPIYEKARLGDVKHSLADISLAEKLIGYAPEVGFKEGLIKTVEWFKEQR